MASQIPEAGAVNEEIVRELQEWWREAAERTGSDLSSFDPNSPLDERIAWALKQGLEIGTVYSRYSSKRQHSTPDQVRTCVQHAAQKGIYCPPEYACADEAQRGYRTRREGLDRMLAILKNRCATVLLVFKASRLYRQAFKGYQLIQQEVVEEGLRAISVTQGIDTADTKAWRMLFQVHGIVDDMVIEATADHVRAGLRGLFAHGYTVGALPVGYHRKELPNAPLTNRGLARTVPETDPEAAEMIREHFRLIRDGMPIRKAWRKWVADGGSADPRSTKGYMSSRAYRRMLSRISYTGRFEFGRRRNEYSTKRDYSRQIEQPDSEVDAFLCEELRIVDDELFFAVQRRLAELKRGPRGPKKNRKLHLWDLVTDLFWCPRCNERYYVAGAGGHGMQCKNGDLCPCKSAVRREEAVHAICAKLCELIHRDVEMVEAIICHARELDARGDDQLREEMAALDRKVGSLSQKISDLYELAGQGSDDDRKEVMTRIRSAQAERATARHELSRLQAALAKTTATITPHAVREILEEFTTLLERAASGKLGDKAVYKATAVFRALVGGRVWVYVEQRKGRKRTNVRGVFRPHLIHAVKEAVDQIDRNDPLGEEVSVWLRKPPRLDAIAERVHLLTDVDGLSYRDVAKRLRQEGHNVNSGNVWYSYRRWYEMQGIPVPERRYNNGHRRKSA
ncbi:MAG: recombinase family protein [Planctomycetes bacterium]|nr:recombinase family protein [Planctomycetota bacterium]